MDSKLVKKLLRWGLPPAALLAVYSAAVGWPGVTGALAVVGAGIVASWGVPRLLDKVR